MNEDTAHRMAPLARLIGLVLVAIVGAVYLASASYERTHIDTASANIGSWRIATTGSPVLGSVDVDAMHNAPVPLFHAEREDGERVIVRSPGVVAAGVPAYAVQALVSGSGTDEADFSGVPGVASAAILATLAVLFLWLALLPRWGVRGATTASAVFAFATPMWSVTGNGLWTHTVTVLGITGMAWAASRERWWLLGLFGGIAFWGRAHTMLITAVLAVAIAGARREPRIAVVVGGIGAFFAGLASLWTHWAWGGWIPTGGYDPAGYVDQYDDGAPMFADDFWGVLENEAALLIAPDRGILIWTPVIVLLLPALVRGWRRQPAWTRALLVGGVLYTLLQGLLTFFHGGDGIYGYRLTLELLACAAPALVHAVPDCGRIARALLGPVIGLQVTAIAFGAVLDRFSLQLDEAWTENSFIAAALDVPSMFAVAAAMMAVGALAQRWWAESDTTTAQAR